MSKIKQYDLTPDGWQNATEHQQREVLVNLFERGGFFTEIKVTKKSITALAGTDMSMGAEALGRLLNAIAKSQPTESLIALGGLSCRDNSCLIWPKSIPKGMATNGGCCCFEGMGSADRMRWQQIVRLLKTKNQE